MQCREIKKMEIKEWLNTTLSRRDAVTGTAKIGAAVALSNAITLPFSATAQAETIAAPTQGGNGETVRHSACLVNCGSRCPLKVIVKDDRIVRIEPEGNDSNLLIVFYVQIMPDDLVMQLHRF